jgi:DNA-binding MarR family transcriptional regulator
VPRTEFSPQLICACAAARVTARALTQLYDARLRDSGVETSQFSLLSLLDKRPGCSQAAIGRLLAMDKTTISRNFKLLGQKGWIEPAPGSDTRERGFRLTPTGRERLAAARPLWKSAQGDLRSKMSGEEWTSMLNFFGRVRQAAGAARSEVTKTGATS